MPGHGVPGRAQCQERRMETSPVAVTQARYCPASHQETLSAPTGFGCYLHAPAPGTSSAPTRTSRGSSRDALGCQSSAPGGKGIRAGGDGRQAGAQPQGLKKAVPKMSGKGCLSLRGDSRQRRLPLHPASHIPRPAPCLSSRRLSRLANPGCPRLALLIEPNQ